MKARVPERLERGRLIYERAGPQHTDELAPVLLDPRVFGFLQAAGEPSPTRDDVRRHLVAKDALWELDGFGFWILRDRETGEVVGRGGLQRTDVEGEAEVEIGWAIAPARWRQGLATELAHTSIELGFSALELERLVAFTLPHNVASRRVMEKAGLAYEREIVHAGMPHVLYALQA